MHHGNEEHVHHHGEHDHDSHGHALHDDHGATHTHGHDFEAANKVHFDKTAGEYEKKIPMIIEITAIEAKYIVDNGYNFDPESTSVLNFACGNGLMETTLLAHCKRIVGVDISEGMITKYNERAAELGASDKMKGIATKLKAEDGALDGEKFDVVLCTMAYHHFESPLEITKMLAFFLKPGGVILITDKTLQDVAGDPVLGQLGHIVPFMQGFSDEDMRGILEGAGLEQFQLDLIPKAILKKELFGMKTDAHIFLAKAKKA